MIPAKIPERQLRERSFVFVKLADLIPTTMEISHSRPLSLLQSMLLFLVLGLVVPTRALYFYLEGTTPKCFYEELPKDTLVVGEQDLSCRFSQRLIAIPSRPFVSGMMCKKTARKRLIPLSSRPLHRRAIHHPNRHLHPILRPRHDHHRRRTLRQRPPRRLHKGLLQRPLHLQRRRRR